MKILAELGRTSLKINIEIQMPVKRYVFPERASDYYIQNQFCNYIDNEDNRNFFTELKQTYEKERYLNLDNFEIQNVLSKIKLS